MMLVAGCQLSSAARLRGSLCNGRPVERKKASAPAPRKACAPSLPEDPKRLALSMILGVFCCFEADGLATTGVSVRRRESFAADPARIAAIIAGDLLRCSRLVIISPLPRSVSAPARIEKMGGSILAIFGGRRRA